MTPHTWPKATAPYTNLNSRGTKNPSVNGKTSFKASYYYYWASQVALVVKNLLANAGRSPGVGSDNLLKYSCLENPMERGAWQATAHEITESNMTERLSTKAHSFTRY